ncbi:hypothetical protein SAMN04487904_101107 [Actinopolyspora lacussalsi subsp. righensis]|uniref:Uncharacterized protein n=1 Tax=Actinopolyspora righensis TaxID=995060 RepID=A0A1I6X4B4_9ACTN|nr:hypothetical protein SAMN04487904_101107 [Actinopolyspora righensis]
MGGLELSVPGESRSVMYQRQLDERPDALDASGRSSNGARSGFEVEYETSPHSTTFQPAMGLVGPLRR